jgi:protoporphyrinogen oxidase
MSTVFLFGAGASYGSGECYPKNPPLGPGLFAELQRWGGVAATVDEDLRRTFEGDFEKGMEHFFRTRNSDITPFLREMADYFAQFEPGPNNYYGQS